MPEQKDQEYKFAPLSDYSLKQRILIRLADLAFYACIKVLGTSMRFELRGAEHLEAVDADGKFPIYALWHDRIFLGTYYLRGRDIGVMTSRSFDGEYIARFVRRFGHLPIRGSSSSGGSRALVEMIKSMRTRRHPMAFTVDGPRGPRYEVKPGPVILAKKTGNPIMPFVIEAKRFWALKSWDKGQIPKPFTQALTIIGEPIYVAADASDDEVNEKLALLQRTLDDLVEQGKEWSGRT